MALEARMQCLQAVVQKTSGFSESNCVLMLVEDDMHAGLHRPVLPHTDLCGRGNFGHAVLYHFWAAVPVSALQAGHTWG